MISLAGDVVAQKIVEKKENWDVVRSARFAAIGGCLSPLIHFWYIFVDKFLAGKPKLVVLLADQVGFSTVLTVLFFALMGISTGNVSSIPSTVVSQLPGTMLSSWKLWPLAQYINFNFVPSNLRVLFGNVVGFFWSIYLSGRMRS